MYRFATKCFVNPSYNKAHSKRQLKSNHAKLESALLEHTITYRLLPQGVW